MVHILSSALSLLRLGAAVSAAPAPAPTAAPNVADALAAVEKRAGSCTFSDPAVPLPAIKSKASCATIVISAVAVPSGTTLDLTGLKSGTHVVFEGTTTFGYEEWSGPLVSVSGTDITVTGASGSVLDGNGAKYWDGKGTNGGKTKPKFFYAHSLKGKSSINNVKILNSPVQVFSINSASGLTLSGITIDNSAGNSLGHNTDAFDVGSSTDITISGANVQNQDDCLAINSGTGITFTGGTCSGGHGLSIGSVGGRSDNVVSDVIIESSTVKNSANGVRIKTVLGATGSVSGVTYKDITLSGITSYGVVIEQDYENGSPTGKPTSGVPITGVTLSNVHGTVSSSATNVYVLCAKCSGWTWDVNVTGGKTSTKCAGLPSGVKC
uniref:Endo-polygalacturonase 1 n=1 Tax=Sclerotinia sclerotiorum TaxID=5180 RepID=PGLR1_SCLSC|nr:RecName: Full=Endo-polygalacturonase; Short=PG; AltName: Full=Pectinase; Flags: Precursor [Sclerotinia sclerotiorum]AAC14466.1 endopolygalacturonase [Sclerotinia sclerotiorum]